MNQINIYVNGETINCPQGLTLPQLLEHQSFNPKLVAVEYNGEIVHRQYWEQTVIHEADRLEVVTIVGGGCR
jgi:sulfur carrier protein